MQQVEGIGLGLASQAKVNFRQAGATMKSFTTYLMLPQTPLLLLRQAEMGGQ
jgi:hypothetical protein